MILINLTLVPAAAYAAALASTENSHFNNFSHLIQEDLRDTAGSFNHFYWLRAMDEGTDVSSEMAQHAAFLIR